MSVSYQMTATETVPNARRRTIMLSDVPTYMMGPFQKKLFARTNVIYLVMLIVGILPSILDRAGIVSFSPKILAAFWGLWFPGAGLIATGTIAGIILGIIIALFYAKFATLVESLSGMMLLLIYLWVAPIIAAPFLAKNPIPLYGWLIIFAVFLIIQLDRFHSASKTHKEKLRLRQENIDCYQALVEELKSNQKEPQNPSERELSEDDVKATRFLFDFTLNREEGDITGYDIADQIQLGAVRYSWDYLGYALAEMQCFYTPNFHGYLNHAQQYVIDSLTTEQGCGYWKMENLWGNLSLSADPVKKDNIMYSGWSGILPVLYTGNTGDLRYEKEGALNFRPYKNQKKSFPYNNESLVKAIAKQWEKKDSALIPCEPHYAFPWCNGYGIITVQAYDRIHGTDYVEKSYSKLEKRLTEDWTDPDGRLCTVKNTLIGTMASAVPGDMQAASNFAVSRIYNPFDPGLAEKEYVLGKHTVFGENANGEIEAKLGPWDKLQDTGNFKRGPGSLVGGSASAAKEMGDIAFAEELLRIADETLERVDDVNCHYYKNASTGANAMIVLARLAQKDDLYNMVHHGPGKAALEGPILTDCKYPEVLVAKARSHTGDDLELVLYNGKEAGIYEIGIERLIPGQMYCIEETEESFIADQDGRVHLKVALNGRTELHIRKR
ncbi:MAG: hypothetical protein IKD64_08800 [Lachnospiraceae bacterium]|nr:hypothetical protein [Lachnospiraceae bacterium]